MTPATRSARAHRVEAAALELFSTRGYEATTVDDLAAAGGVGRRTFFRYFPTKLDVILGELDEGLAALVGALASSGPDVDPVQAARRAFLLVNAYAPDDVPLLRRRLQLVQTVPDLAARAAVRYDGWERAVAADAARRWGCPTGALRPQVFARAAVAAMRGVFTVWIADPTADGEALSDLVGCAFDDLAAGFAAPR